MGKHILHTRCTGNDYLNYALSNLVRKDGKREHFALDRCIYIAIFARMAALRPTSTEMRIDRNPQTTAAR